MRKRRRASCVYEKAAHKATNPTASSAVRNSNHSQHSSSHINKGNIMEKDDDTDNNNSKMVIPRRPLDWQLTKNSLAERGSYLLETGIWSDCTFIVGVQAQNIKVRHLKLRLTLLMIFYFYVIRCSVATKCFWPWPLQFLKPCSLAV